MSGEQKPKVKVENGGGKRNNYQPYEHRFTAPTPGLEDKVFEYKPESTRMSTVFTSTLNVMADYVAVSFSNSSTDAGKAIREIIVPTYTPNLHWLIRVITKSRRYGKKNSRRTGGRLMIGQRTMARSTALHYNIRHRR